MLFCTDLSPDAIQLYITVQAGPYLNIFYILLRTLLTFLLDFGFCGLRDHAPSASRAFGSTVEQMGSGASSLVSSNADSKALATAK